MNTGFRPGDHLVTNRGLYEHHGIYVGDDLVIHFTATSKRKEEAEIRTNSVEDFAHGDPVRSVEYAECSPPEVVIGRARKCLGRDGYSLFSNNCEHFARWCKTGSHESQQIRELLGKSASLGSSVGLGVGSIGMVSAAGTVAGLSGPGIMSGLATVGGTIGTGAIGGVALLAAGPAVLTTAATHVALRDDPCMPEHERSARKVGRWGTTASSVAAGGGAVALVSAAGLPGLSAAGITSGLAAIGGTVGGGMATGAFLVIAAPAAIGTLFGWGLYRLLTRR